MESWVCCHGESDSLLLGGRGMVSVAWRILPAVTSPQRVISRCLVVWESVGSSARPATEVKRAISENVFILEGSLICRGLRTNG